MRALYRLGQHLAARDVVILPVVGDLFLRPNARQHVGEFLPHAARILQIAAIRGQLIGITGPAQPDIDPTPA